MPHRSHIILFGGPSLSEKAKDLCRQLRIEVRPPVQRGDLDQLIEAGFRGTVIIVDGVFQQVMSVGHKELLTALRIGLRIFGLSSMGAIRALEMSAFGMKGYGEVYRRFEAEEDFQDDEVTLLHEPDPPYRKVSEPLVHFRACVEDLVNKQFLPPDKGASIIDRLKSLYFGDRSLALFKNLLGEAGIIFDDLIRDFEPYRIKERDLERFLEQEQAAFS